MESDKLRHDTLWEKYHARLTELGVVVPRKFDCATQFNITHYIGGKYGDVNVVVEYHVGNMDWPGWVDVYDGKKYMMFVHIRGGYNGTVLSSTYLLGEGPNGTRN